MTVKMSRRPGVKKHTSRRASDSSGGAEERPKNTRRISFGPNEVRHKLEFTGTPSEENQRLRHSGHTPRSILKVKLKKASPTSTSSGSSKKTTKKPKPPKLSFGGIEDEASDVDDVIMEDLPSMADEPSVVEESIVAKSNTATVQVRTPSKRKLGKLQITRTMKEQMLKMSRFERKRFLRDFKMKRRPFGEIAKRCTVLWEVVRGTKADKIKKGEAIEEIMNLIKGKCGNLIYSHDTVRVIESLMAIHNRQDIRDAIYGELKDDVQRMSKSKYARFFVQKMFKHGTPEQREHLFRQFKGKCSDMMRHAYASLILEYAYNDYANAQQRFMIVREFYGHKFTLATMTTGREVRSLSDVLASEPSHKESIVTHLRGVVLALVEKEAIKHSLTHRLMHEYMTHASDEQRTELVGAIRDKCLEIVHTRDGVYTAMHCAWQATAKERKALARAIKPLAVKTAVEEHASLLLLALFDCTDDTVLLKTCIIDELARNLPTILASMHGVHTIDYLMSPRDGRYMGAELKTLLAKACSISTLFNELDNQGDTSGTSLKDPLVRRRQLRSYMAPAVADHVQRHMGELLFDKSRCLFLLNLLQSKEAQTLEDISQVPDETRLKCYEAIADECAKEFIPCNLEERLHSVEHANAHFVIRHLLKADAVLVKVDKEAITLVKTIMERVPLDSICTWTGCNKGCWVIVHMLESTVSPEITAPLKSKLKKWRTKLSQSSHSGSIALLAAIDK